MESKATKTEIVPGQNGHAVILDLGKKKRKDVKQLRGGKGKLLEEISSSIEELRTTGAVSASAQPIIVVVREKDKKRQMLPMLYR